MGLAMMNTTFLHQKGGKEKVKQIIIRIKDCKGKLVAKDYYYSQTRFNEEASNFIYRFLRPGDEVQIKIGNQYAKYLTHSELLDLMKDYELLDGVKYNEKKIIQMFLVDDYGVQYYMKEHLPEW